MSQAPPLDTCNDKELKFLEKHKLKTQDFFEANEYYTDCPYCNYPFLFVYPRPTIVDDADVKFDKLYCYCNGERCHITGPLHSIRKDPTYTPPEGIKRFVYDCQCHYNNYVANVVIENIDKTKNFPSIELLNKIGVVELYEDVLKEFKGFLGYATRAGILHFNSNSPVKITQKLPYRIPKDTWGLILPFGPQPGYHVGFVVIYEGVDDIEIYTVRDTIYMANGRDNYIFFNCIIDYESDTEDTIKEGGASFLDREDEEDGKEWGIRVLVADSLDPIDLMTQDRKIVKDRFGPDACERAKIKKPGKARLAKKKALKNTAKRKSSKR